MGLAKRISLILSVLGLFFIFPGCTEDNPKTTPLTVFDQTVPDPRSDDVKVVDFIVQLEKRYKREEIRNDVDLHFTGNGPRRIQVRLTYSRDADPTKVSSVADAAIELVKRLKREDASVRGIDIAIERVVVRREE